MTHGRWDPQPVHKEIEALLDQIRAVTTNPAIERATDKISVICRAYLEPDLASYSQRDGVKHSMTPTESRFFDLFQKRIGCTVSKSALMDVALHKYDHEPDMKIIDVQVCNLRKKLVGVGYKIETVWGTGYRMTPCKIGDGGPTYRKDRGGKSRIAKPANSIAA